MVKKKRAQRKFVVDAAPPVPTLPKPYDSDPLPDPLPVELERAGEAPDVDALGASGFAEQCQVVGGTAGGHHVIDQRDMAMLQGIAQSKGFAQILVPGFGG